MHSLHERMIDMADDSVKESDQEQQVNQSVVIDSAMLEVFKAKKHTKRGCVVIGLQLVTLLLETFYEIWLLGVVAPHIATRTVGAALLCLSVYQYASAFRSLFWRVALFVVQHLVILSVNSELFYLQKPASSVQLLLIFKLLMITLASDLHLFHLQHLALLQTVGYVLPLAFSVGFHPSSLQSHDISCLVFYCGLMLLRKYRIQHLTKEMYLSQAKQDKQKTEQEALVSQLLPKHAFLKLRNQNLSNKIELTDEIEGATLLFADIKGFTSYSNKNTP